MPHVFEIASSGRAKCRACGQAIARDTLRFGERQPNAFGEGEMTLWFHPRCAAYTRPEPFLEALAATGSVERNGIEDAAGLQAAAEFGIAHRRVPRVHGADRAPTGRARCRHCKELIEKGSWRVALFFFEEYRFQPSGYVHAQCVREYLETTEIIERVRWFNPALGLAELLEIRRALEAQK